ncbi:MAG: AAA family ATPase [Planctomycetaceae bacterium]|nr:AAA family ATPase [Planctomycetaceae bacterium]
MHVESIRLRYFKKFRDEQLSFIDDETGLARSLIVLVGDNGSGKSTVLQAIAATLGTATRRLHEPADLDWPGYDLSLAGNAWALPSEVVLKVGFSQPELNATVEYFQKVPGLEDRPGVTPPSQDSSVSLTLREGHVRAEIGQQYFQFRGREYAKQIVKLVEEGHRVFENVGTVFWYTEHRTSTSLTAEMLASPSDIGDSSANGGYLQYDENLLRRRLADLMQFHSRIERGEYQLRPGQRDLFADIEKAYATVFPNRRFEGSVPRSDVDEVLSEPWFFLYDGHHQYELSEMSGGERAIFPLIFDFANWQINNSVVLIDEIDLHLHPPLQQALIRALPDLGKNNQFIITSHSDWIVQYVPPECVCRMGGLR